jgi:hypothetical protein
MGGKHRGVRRAPRCASSRVFLGGSRTTPRRSRRRGSGVEAGATGLEPATSGVTGRSWRLRAKAGIGGDFRREQGLSTLALRGFAGMGGEVPATSRGKCAGCVVALAENQPELNGTRRSTRGEGSAPEHEVAASHLLPTDEAATPAIGSTRDLEDAVLGEVGHDRVEVVLVERPRPPGPRARPMDVLQSSLSAWTVSRNASTRSVSNAAAAASYAASEESAKRCSSPG